MIKSRNAFVQLLRPDLSARWIKSRCRDHLVARIEPINHSQIRDLFSLSAMKWGRGLGRGGAQGSGEGERRILLNH
jgi:hypothetical protein